MKHRGLHRDFLDLLRLFARHQVEYLVVGAHAMAVHGVPRATGDLDLWLRPTSENAARAFAALAEFGAPLADHGLRSEDLAGPGLVYQLGLPPRRIDLLTSLTGLQFDQAWEHRLEVKVADLLVPFLGREDLIRNKKATGREKDLLDARILEGQKD